MEKFSIPPDQDGYTVEDGIETISVALDGGLSRSRADIIGAAATVSVKWTLDPNNYLYIRSFYKGTTRSGAEPFLLDLLYNVPTLTECVCKFIPGTFKLIEQTGLTYVVAATLEVVSVEDDLDEMTSYALMMGIYGDESISFMNELGELVNIDLPAIDP